LASAAFQADRVEALQRAQAAGVTELVEIGTSPEDWDRVIQVATLAKQTPNAPRVAVALGIHPHDAAACNAGSLSRLKQKVAEAAQAGIAVAAIGEIGLDYFRDYAPRETQRAAFEAQLRLASELKLPVVIHCRAAEEELYPILENELHAGGDLRGVMHCFSGTAAWACKASELGLYLAFNGVLTYPKAEKNRVAATAVPKEKLVLETDCPYLAPQSKRGERNEPAYLPQSGAKLAAVLGLTTEAVAKLTSDNARRLFGI
jgi:TatD DNase family protein